MRHPRLPSLRRVGVDVLARDARGGWRNVTGGWPQGRTVPAPVPARAGILISPGQIWCGTLSGSVTGAALSIRPGDSTTPAWTGTELLALTDAGRLLALHR
jgi:hypothetical protein